jgi:hypothetical protein
MPKHGISDNSSADRSSQSLRGRLICPCCGSGVALHGTDGGLRLESDETIAWPAAAGTMFIDSHAHMISRTTDDYEAMAAPASSQ